jgi:hypothetical protein
MATFNKLNGFVEHLAEKVHDLGADTLTIALSKPLRVRKERRARAAQLESYIDMLRTLAANQSDEDEEFLMMIA